MNNLSAATEVKKCKSSLTLAESLRCNMAGSLTGFPEAFFVALIRSERAEATSLTAFMSKTFVEGRRKQHANQVAFTAEVHQGG